MHGHRPVTGWLLVILDEKATRWELQVLEVARREGWTTYPQDLRNRRQHDPSCILLRPGRLLLVYLRMTRRNEPPLRQLSALLGAEAVLWTPTDGPAMRAALARGVT